MIKELANYVQAQTSFIVGTNLFAGFIPSDAQDDCIVLIESGGKASPELPDAEGKMLQVLSRAKDYHTARNNAYSIYNFFQGRAGIKLAAITSGGSKYLVNSIAAVSLPQSLGPDEKGLFNISTNFILQLQDDN